MQGIRMMTGLAVAVASLAGAACAAEKNGWADLFDGKTIEGWVQRGGKAVYRAEGEAIVGKTVVNTPNSFLCTPRDYANFELEYEFKVDPGLNSGVQIRSQYKEKENRVHGYQVEIDPEPSRQRWWSAGIYEEGGRGWLFPGLRGGDAKAFTEQGAKLFKQNDWNHVRVVCNGDRIQTWLNGTACADLRDDKTASGFIALQVHSCPKPNLEVAWRKLRIKELPASAQP